MAAIQLSTESAIRRSLPFSPATPAAAQLDATTGTQVAHASRTLRGTPEPQLRGARATVADARTRVRSGGSTTSEAPARVSSRRRVAEGRDPAQINRRPGRAASSGDQTSFTNQRRASSLTKYPRLPLKMRASSGAACTSGSRSGIAIGTVRRRAAKSVLSLDAMCSLSRSATNNEARLSRTRRSSQRASRRDSKRKSGANQARSLQARPMKPSERLSIKSTTTGRSPTAGKPEAAGRKAASLANWRMTRSACGANCRILSSRS